MKPFTVKLEQASDLVSLCVSKLSKLESIKSMDAKMNSFGEWEISAQRLQEQYSDRWDAGKFETLVKELKQQELERQVSLQKAEIEHLKEKLAKAEKTSQQFYELANKKSSLV